MELRNEETNRKTIRYYFLSTRLLGSSSYVSMGGHVYMKCKFSKKCPNYEEDSFTCNRSDGYYGDKPATCYKKMEAKK